MGLLIDPMEVFENHHQWLIQALAQQDAFDRIEQCACFLICPVHLGQRVVALGDG